MGNPPSPSFSITPSIFGFLKSLDLRSVDLNPDMVPLVHPITGWEIVMYEPVVVESRFGGYEAESVGESKDYDVERVDNEFVVEDTEDSDEDEPILHIQTNCSNQFHPRNLPKNGLPQNKYMIWLKNLMHPRRRKLEEHDTC